MSPSADRAARLRLGRLLAQARVRQDLRYKNRALFARERGMNPRLLQDIETAYRDNFEPPTLMAIERAYGWAPGSIDRILADGDPVPLGSPPEFGDMPLVVEDNYDDEFVRKLWEIGSIPVDARLALIESYLEHRDRDDNGGDGAEVRCIS